MCSSETAPAGRKVQIVGHNRSGLLPFRSRGERQNGRTAVHDQSLRSDTTFGRAAAPMAAFASLLAPVRLTKGG